MVTAATNRQLCVVGKPDPMMFRSAMNRIEAHSQTPAMIDDRMDTDIIAGVEAGLLTVSVLSGVTAAAEIEVCPYRPSLVLDSVADLSPMI